MKQLKTTQIVLWMLLSVPFVSLKAQQSLWVGEEYQCFLTDYANTSLSILNVSWTVPSEMKEEFSGTYVRTVSFSQYQSGTYSVRASWKETDMSDSFSPFYSRSHTWSFTCRDNPLVLNSSSLTLTKGSTGTIGYSHTYSNEYTSLAKVTYSSSNSSVASVSSTGVVTAKGAGTATITVTSTIAKDAKTCTVTVKATPGIQFADAKVKALCVANWDTNGDGELSKAEAAAVTDLREVFRNNTEITEFEELEYFTGLTSIDDAFYNCSRLTYVTIPESVTSIGYSAFRNCSGLTSITIPNSVTSIGGGAFDGTKWYNNQPDGLVYAGKVAYKYKGTMPEGTEIVIKDGTLGIAGSAFWNCSGLTSITIPNSVTSIGRSAFSRTAWYDNQPDGLVYAGKVAYEYKGTMPEGTEIVIRDGTLGIAAEAFFRQPGLTCMTSITIPESVTNIGDWAFNGCGSLTSITIPNSVTSIGEGAFAWCSGLTSVYISNNVTSIGEGAFMGCSGLKSIAVESGNIKYDSRDNCNAIIETASNTLIAGCENSTIPESVTSIGEGAFNDCDGLTSITIPESVTSIGNFAFNDCDGLTSVTIPNSVTNIGNNAFRDCRGLTSVIIGSSVTSIGESAFEYCSSLTDVYCYAEKVPETIISRYYPMFSSSASATLHVPAGSVEAYKTTAPWSGFGTIVAIEDVTLGDLTGDGKVSITDIVMIVDVIAGDITDANQVAAADVNGDGKVSITDCSAAVDLIAAGTSTPSSARKKANAMFSDTDFISGTLHDGLLSIDLEAEHRFTAFQMTVSVPEGMTLGNGSMNAQRGADHLLTVRNLGGGRYLVAGFSADNEELTAGNGCLLTLATEGQADADIVISDIEFATTQAEAYYLADAAVSSTPTGINEMKNEELRVKNEIYDLQGRRVEKATKGIYIYNGKKTMIK